MTSAAPMLFPLLSIATRPKIPCAEFVKYRCPPLARIPLIPKVPVGVFANNGSVNAMS